MNIAFWKQTPKQPAHDPPIDWGTPLQILNLLEIDLVERGSLSGKDWDEQWKASESREPTHQLAIKLGIQHRCNRFYCAGMDDVLVDRCAVRPWTERYVPLFLARQMLETFPDEAVPDAQRHRGDLAYWLFCSAMLKLPNSGSGHPGFRTLVNAQLFVEEGTKRHDLAVMAGNCAKNSTCVIADRWWETGSV